MYCAVASLELMGVLDTLAVSRRQGLLEWCVSRQVNNTRVVWCGAVLAAPLCNHVLIDNNDTPLPLPFDWPKEPRMVAVFRPTRLLLQ